MATIAEVAAHDYERAAGKHRQAQARALRQAHLFDRQSAVAQDLRRDATAMLAAERAHTFRATADAHLKAADILGIAARSEGRA